jgi:mannose-6-phosphate isomerase-like protein (cupin superfamily)
MLKHVEKGWGHEEWIVNNDLYCGKILYFKEGKKCSFHMHLIKDETFYINSGALEVVYGLTDDIEDATKVILIPGDSLRILPGTRHQMLGLEDTVMFEFSTHHEDSDSYRIIKGD